MRCGGWGGCNGIGWVRWSEMRWGEMRWVGWVGKLGRSERGLVGGVGEERLGGVRWGGVG